MQTSITPTPLTVGKLLGRTIGMYRAHGGVFLRTSAIFYLPVAILSFFYVEDISTATIFAFVATPIEAVVSLAIIAHCVDSLHGRPLDVRSAVERGLRRLLANIGMMIAASAVYLGIFLILAIPIWVGLFRTGFPFGEIIDAFSAPFHPGDVEVVMNVLGSALWGASVPALPES